MESEKAIIRIISRQYTAPDDDGSEMKLVSEGCLRRLSDGFEISYDETQATGFDGSSTCLTYRDGGYVTMNRSGQWSSRLILEQGKRHICRYGTPFGDMNVAVTTSMVSANVDAAGKGVTLEFHYKIDIASELIGSYEICIQAIPEEYAAGNI